MRRFAKRPCDVIQFKQSVEAALRGRPAHTIGAAKMVV